MKTSLIISDHVFLSAKKEAEKTGRTISDVINEWAKSGLELKKNPQKKRLKKYDYVAHDGGKVLVDINSRRDWADVIHNDKGLTKK